MRLLLLVHNLETGQKECLNKLLLQISIRELHNDMLLPPDQGGFKEAWEETGNARISDTALHALLPEQAWRMTPRHKQMCGCEVCIQIRSLQQSLNAWRHRRLKLLTELADAASSEEERQAIEVRKLLYKSTVMPNDEVWHPQPKMALKVILYDERQMMHDTYDSQMLLDALHNFCHLVHSSTD
jgi:hypothetical protein